MPADCAASVDAARAAARRRAPPRALPGRSLNGAHPRGRQSEGRRRQDHDQRQPRRGLAQAGKRVLLVDLDPQGNATMGSGVDKRTLARTVYHVLLGLGDLDDDPHARRAGGYDLVPANRELAGAEVELVDLPNREDAAEGRAGARGAATTTSS